MDITMKYPKIFIDGIDYSNDPETAEVLLNHSKRVWLLSIEPEPVVNLPKPERKLKAVGGKK